jgi:hypothetical protein
MKMSSTSKDMNSAALGVFYARLEEGRLVMEPYCSCGNQLDEGYNCEKCNKHCQIPDILCEDQATLNLVEKYGRTSPKFRNFNIMLGKRKTTKE